MYTLPGKCNGLRSQGLPAERLFEVYRGVVIAKLLYAASAWWGFTSADYHFYCDLCSLCILLFAVIWRIK